MNDGMVNRKEIAWKRKRFGACVVCTHDRKANGNGSIRANERTNEHTHAYTQTRFTSGNGSLLLCIHCSVVVDPFIGFRLLLLLLLWLALIVGSSGALLILNFRCVCPFDAMHSSSRYRLKRIFILLHRFSSCVLSAYVVYSRVCVRMCILERRGARCISFRLPCCFWLGCIDFFSSNETNRRIVSLGTFLFHFRFDIPAAYSGVFVVAFETKLAFAYVNYYKMIHIKSDIRPFRIALHCELFLMWKLAWRGGGGGGGGGGGVWSVMVTKLYLPGVCELWGHAHRVPFNDERKCT